MLRVRTLIPLYTQCWVIAGPPAILHCYGATDLGKILCSLRLAVYVAVYKHRSLTFVCGIEGLTAIQSELALTVNASSTQCIICTFKVAFLKLCVLSANERTKVQTRDKTAVTQQIAVATAYNELCLHYGGLPLAAVLAWVFIIYKVNVAIIAKRYVLCLYVIAYEMEHSEVAYCALCLSAVTRKDHIIGIVAETDKPHPVHFYRHSEGCVLTFRRLSYRFLVGVVYPIDGRGDVYLRP